MRISHYRVTEKLGAGGMGEVYRAVDERLGRQVAVKLLSASHAGSSDRQLRLLREAQAASALNHPGIVTVFDVGTTGQRPFMVMELVEGVRFSEIARSGVDPGEALRLCIDAAEAMEAAHERGILHRDVKSDNLMRSDQGRVKVLDFGLAKLLDPSVLDSAASSASGRRRGSVGEAAELAFGPTIPPSDGGLPLTTESDDSGEALDSTLTAPAAASGDVSLALSPTISTWGERTGRAPSDALTRVGDIIGTPAYMSPEQAAGEPLDHKSEVFSLGVVLYELLVGLRPFRGSTVAETLEQVKRGTFTPPTRAAPDRALPDGIDAVVSRALARDPDERFPSMAAFAQALRALSPSARPGRSDIHLRHVVAGLAAVALAGAVIAWSMAGRGSAADSNAAARAAPRDLRPHSAQRLTMAQGCEEFPSFSPDGKTLVFNASVDDGYSLFSIDLTSKKRTRLTRPKGWDYKASFAPDGARLAFLRRTDGVPKAYITSADATGVPLALAQGGLRPSWSPDSTNLWAGSTKELTRIDVTTQKVTRRLSAPADHIILHLQELADGRVVGIPYGADVGYVGLGVVVYPPSAGPDVQPTWLWKHEVEQVLTIAPNGDAIVASRSKAATTELWRVPLDGTAPSHISGGAVAASAGLDFHVRSGRVAWSDCNNSQQLTILRRRGDKLHGSPLRISRWSDFDPVAIPGTSRAVAISDRSGEIQIWEIDPSGTGAPRVIPTPGHKPSSLTVSPDGARIAFAEEGKGLYVVPRAGGRVDTIREGPGYWYPTFTRDGRSVVFQYEPDKALPRIGIIPVAGGEVRWVVKRAASEPAADPAHDRIAVVLQTDAKNEVGIPVLVDISTGKHTPASPGLEPGWYHNLRFSSDGRRLLALKAGKKVIEVDLGTGRATDVYSTGVNQFMGVTYLGNDVLAGLSVWSGDLWVGRLSEPARP